MEAPVMLWALDLSILHKAIGKMRVAVRAITVSRIQAVVFIAINGVGLARMVEANYIGAPQRGSGTCRNPALSIGRHLGCKNTLRAFAISVLGAGA